MARLSKPKHPTSPPDYVFISLLFILVIFGLVMLSSASSDLAKIKFNDSYYYLKHQLVYGLSLGVVGFFLGSFIYYRRLEKWAIVLLVISIISLLLVFSPLGVKVKGSARWLQFRDFSFQPGEFIKLTFLIYLSSWISSNQKRGKSFTHGLLPFLFLTSSVTLLLILQPSTTTAVIIFGASLLMYFTAGARIRFLILTALLAGLALSTLVYFTPYRLERILSFLHPEVDVLGSGYHLTQAQISIGAGGLKGVGYGQSTTKLKYLPEPIGDSIFAVIAEELGFLGAFALVLIFLLFIARGLMIAKTSSDNFGRFLATSFISLIGLQAFVNIAAISGLIPLTGIPLPFISYGGTALSIFLTMSGIIVNVSRYRR